jgi:hypothetical protein
MVLSKLTWVLLIGTVYLGLPFLYRTVSVIVQLKPQLTTWDAAVIPLQPELTSLAAVAVHLSEEDFILEVK